MLFEIEKKTLLIWLKRIKFINIYSNQQVFSLSLTFHALVEFMMMYVNIIFLYWMICWIYSQNINIYKTHSLC